MRPLLFYSFPMANRWTLFKKCLANILIHCMGKYLPVWQKHDIRVW